MKQADSSLLFPLLMKALETCVSPRVYTIFEKVRIYGDISPDRSIHILSRKSSHKDTPISVLFLDILVGKVNK